MKLKYLFKFYSLNLFTYISRKYLSSWRVCIKKLVHSIAGGKIGTKSNIYVTPNFLTYRNRRNSLAFKPLSVTNKRLYSSIINNKSDYVNRKLVESILKEIGNGNWITTIQRKELIEFIEKTQRYLSVLGLEKDYRKTYYVMELLLNSLLYQIYAIEILVSNKGSKTPGLDNRVLKNNAEEKIRLLSELKKFRNRKPLPLKRIYISKANDEKRPLGISSIIDLAIQQLFVLVLDPIIESNSDSYSYGFRKGRNQIMAIGGIQKKLQSKIRVDNKLLEPIYIWDADIRKCFDSINHAWLMENTPIPPKYKYILKGWLKSGTIEFGTSNVIETNEVVPQGGIISPLLMNLCLNGMENLLIESMYEYKKLVPKSTIRKRDIDGLRLAIKYKGKDGFFKEHNIDCKIFRYADNFVVISGSTRLLNIIKSKFEIFLMERGLEIHPMKSRTIKFGLKTPFEFLGYTFIYLIRTSHIRSKLLNRNIEYRLKGRPRLYVHPSLSKYKVIKSKIKALLDKNLNSSAYTLINELNPIIREWVNYYSYYNSMGILRSFRGWLYNRIVIWMRKKHPKVAISWLNRNYLLIENILEQHNFKDDPSIIQYIDKLKLIEQVRACKWNFYGIARKSAEGQLYKIPKINVMLWPDRIKKLVTATVFTPNRKLLGSSFYINKDLWIKETIKFHTFHVDKVNKLYSYRTALWKRDQGICFLCEQSLSENLSDLRMEIEIHHIIPHAKGDNNQMKNLALTHKYCYQAYHSEIGPITKTIRNKLSKNRRSIK